MALFFFLPRPAFSQTTTSNLSGTITDASGSVIPGAKVVLTDQATKVDHVTTTNASGSFSYVALNPGTYDLTVTAKGFTTWRENGIVINQSETLAVPPIRMKVGTMSQVVTVSAAALPVPVSTGASSTTLNNRMVSQLAIQGRNASELLRLMPAMAMNTGLNQSPWTSQLTQINSGPAGSYSASGTPPNGGMQLVMNGSVILDPGNQGTQVANINQDMTQQVTIKNSAFDAEYAHGPVTFNAVGKRGTSAFHGEGYLYTRNGDLNSEDSLLKAKGIKKPYDTYYYPGFNIGGPILIPGTSFNKNHNRAFFFFGFEDMRQNPAGFLHQWVTPTPAMLNGNFTTVGTQFAGLWPAYQEPTGNCYGKDASGNSTGTQYAITGGVIPSQCIDPNGKALMKLLMNAPGVQYNNNAIGYNASFLDSAPVDSQNWNVRGDVNLFQHGAKSMKAFITYTRQPESDINNIGVWWWPNGSLPYPSSLPANQVARDWSVGATNVFSPSLTNQFTFGIAYFINPVALANPSAVDPTKLGYNVTAPYKELVPQIPDIVSWCCGGGGGNINSTANAAGFDAPAFGSNWYSGGAFGKDSNTPDISDNLSWMVRNHMMKFGFFWASYANVQTEGYGAGPNGWWNFDTWCNGSTNNIYADMLTGQGACSFSQTNTIPVDNVRYHEMAFYAQDQWQATRKLSISYGLRLDHEGQWYPSTGNAGLAVWNPAAYDASKMGLTGFQWHGINSSIPISGFQTQSIFPDPRFGVAYDLFGNGKTVLRGGFGIYRFQIAYNDVTNNAMLDGPLGVLTYTSNCQFHALTDLSTAACTAPGSSSLTTPPSGRSGITQAGAMIGDNKSPYTESWDVIIDQAAPWHSLFEIQYQGNRSRNMLITGQGNMADVNLIPLGAEFKPDPVTGITYFCLGPTTPTCNAGPPPSSALQDYRPYDYSSVVALQHSSYSNYNAMVLQWMKQSGPIVVNLNYTWSHALGIRDANSDNGGSAGAGVNPLNLASNYGTLAFNRAQIFNASYVINLPSPIHHNAFLKQAVNGWQLSGVTTWQSGPPLQPLTGGTLNVGYGQFASGPLAGDAVDSQSVLGTDLGQVLVPYLVCDPTKNLQSGQYFNPNCFSAPTKRGVNGQLIWPNITGPGFFDSDLGLYKNFKVREGQQIQFRITAFNFLNHPNPQFGLTNDINLSFSNSAGLVTQTNQNTVTNGKPAYTVGRRVIELALKYTF